MRGDAALTLRLLLRGGGVAGLCAAAGGALALTGAFAPWRTTVAEVSLLGTTDERVISVVRGLPSTAGGWVVAALGLVALALGVAIALDRPPRRSRVLVVAASTACLLTAIAVLTLGPAGEAPGQAELLARLGAEGGRLPGDVEVTGQHRHGVGPWLAVVGAGLALAGGAAAREV